MHVVNTIAETRRILAQQRQQNNSIGFVPTMGALHEGHLSLIRRSVKENDFTAISIFVNPLQFGPEEDLDAYPRTEIADQQAAEKNGVDLIFHPSAKEILGDEILTFVDIEKLQDNLCGMSRPGHFRGVCTIVAKLFNILQPDRAYFGQKDLQQYIIIEKMAQDLNFDIDIVRCPIVREYDGLAMSSRNSYMDNKERQDAVILNRCIKEAVRMMENGERSTEIVLSRLKDMIRLVETTKIDYVKIVDRDMRDVDTISKGDILALAVYIGSTRLIDNHIFGDPVTF